jgi:hypothetical protein
MTKNVLILCATEKTYKEGLSLSIMNTVFGFEEDVKEYDYYYVGVDLKSNQPRKCSSGIQNMLTNCSFFNLPNKFYMIIAENCPYKGKHSIYYDDLKNLLNQFLKPDGYYLAVMDNKFKGIIDDIQYSNMSLNAWMGNEYNYKDLIKMSSKNVVVVYQKRNKSKQKPVQSIPKPQQSLKLNIPDDKNDKNKNKNDKIIIVPKSSKSSSKSIKQSLSSENDIFQTPSIRTKSNRLPNILEDIEYPSFVGMDKLLLSRPKSKSPQTSPRASIRKSSI